MKIAKCQIKNFTVFEQASIEFCKGVNVIIGANGTGKSHLLKILYSMVQTLPGKAEAARDNTDILRFYTRMSGVFKPENGEVNTMIRSRDRKTPAIFHIESDAGHHYAVARRDYHIAGADVTLGRSEPPAWQLWAVENPPGLFIPPNEVLAIYPGFVASYEKRELAFDQTYYDICKALSAAPLKRRDVFLERLVMDLQGLIEGRVIQKGDRFYVESAGKERTLEAHLIAEGHRKIAAIIHLLNNGSIGPNTILFWDEPEANLNPRLIPHIAELVRALASTGTQVFIATHDYLLTGELSLAAEYAKDGSVPIRFFAMTREGASPVAIECGDTLADLQENPILDEFAQHYEREQAALVEHRKNGESG